MIDSFDSKLKLKDGGTNAKRFIKYQRKYFITWKN